MSKAHSVIAKIKLYAEHVRQTSADVRQRAQTLPDIGPAEFNTHKMSDKENKNDRWYLPVINWGKCLTGAQNVLESPEGLPNILSGSSEIIFMINDSGFVIYSKMFCNLFCFKIAVELQAFWCAESTFYGLVYCDKPQTSNIVDRPSFICASSMTSTSITYI